MRLQLLIISTIIFLALSFAFALGWDKIYNGGPDEQKGDYIFFCLKTVVVLTFLYLILARILLRKSFPLILVFCAPIIICIVSVSLALLISWLTGNTEDNKVLNMYLFIQGFCVALFIFPFALGARRGVVRP